MWKDISRFILSPQSDLDKVRRYLEQSGFAIGKEAMVEEEGKFYTVMEAAWRECPKSGSAGEEGKKSWYAYGKHLIENKNPGSGIVSGKGGKTGNKSSLQTES